MKYFKVLSNYHYILTDLKSLFLLPPQINILGYHLICQYKIIIIFSVCKTGNQRY